MKPEPESAEAALDLFVELRRSGERVDPAEFVARHAHLGPDVEHAIEAVLALESAGSGVVAGPVDFAGVGPYRVVRELGRGGMGVVYEAIEEPLGRRVALKVLPPQSLASSSARARFRREAELAARLDHPGIATVYGAGVEGDQPWIAMRFVEGPTLAQSIARSREAGSACVRLLDSDARGRDATLAVAACMARIARALQAAHENGVVHRDVKPSNVVLTGDGSPVLVDFGLAIQAESSGHTVSRSGDNAGTPAYFAPEIVSGERHRPDAQTDVYALGVALYECLTLTRPFDAPTTVALYRAILSEEVASARAHNPAVSTDLAVVAATAIERDRTRRYTSAAALADDLEACIAGRPIRARPLSAAGKVARWARREPRQAVLSGALAAAVLGLAVFAGSWRASRDEVNAAANVARLRARDEALARGFLDLKEPGGGVADFARARELDPDSLDALAGLILGDIYRDRRSSAREMLSTAPHTPGFDALRDLLEKRPIAVDASREVMRTATALDLFLIGFGLFHESNDKGKTLVSTLRRRARACVDEAIFRSREPRQPYHVLRSLIAKSLRDEPLARSAAASLLALWPESPSSWTAAGLGLCQVDPEAAVPILEQAARRGPGNPAVLNELGQALTNLGRFGDGESTLWLALARACDVDDNNALGVNYALRGCFEDARAAFEHALAHDSSNQQVWQNLGLAAQMLDDSEFALACFEHALWMDPGNAGLHAQTGVVLHDLGRLDEALAYIRHGAALEPYRPRTWWHLVRAQVELDDLDGARASVEAGLHWAANDAELLQLRDELASIR